MMRVPLCITRTQIDRPRLHLASSFDIQIFFDLVCVRVCVCVCMCVNGWQISAGIGTGSQKEQCAYQWNTWRRWRHNHINVSPTAQSRPTHTHSFSFSISHTVGELEWRFGDGKGCRRTPRAFWSVSVQQHGRPFGRLSAQSSGIRKGKERKTIWFLFFLLFCVGEVVAV